MSRSAGKLCLGLGGRQIAGLCSVLDVVACVTFLLTCSLAYLLLLALLALLALSSSWLSLALTSSH